MVYHFQKRWRLKFRRDPDAGRVLFIGPLVLSLDVHRREGSAQIGCRYDGNPNKDPRGCWNVRCQLGKRCSRLARSNGTQPVPQTADTPTETEQG